MSKTGSAGAAGRDTSVEGQLYGIEQQIEDVEASLIEREAELVDLRVELSAFRLEYDTRVGRKVEELERVETALRRCQERAADYRLWGAKGPPGTRAGTPYVSVEEQFRRTWKEPEEPPSGSSSWEEGLRFSRPSAGTHIKALYRQLCRRFHPDLTQDPAERARRTETMAAVNSAYAARDLAALETLAEKADRSRWIETGTPEQRLVGLKDKLRQLQQRLEQVQQEIRELVDSPAAQMSLDVKLAKRRGRDLLAEMAAQVEKDLTRKRAELDFMVAQLRQLGITA
jgi:hypothetical protein